MSNSIEATRCPSCGQTKCPECDGHERAKDAQVQKERAEAFINLLANIDEMLKEDPDLLEDDDRAVIEDVRKRWDSDFGDTRPSGSTGYPDYDATDPDERSDIGDSCVMGSASTQYVCDCGAPSERKCEHGYCDSKDCRCLCHDKSLHEPPDTKSGPGDCMNFGTPEQLAGMSPPQPVYRYGKKIVLAAKDLSPDALESGATAEVVSGLPPLHFPLEEPPNSISDESEINCGTFTDQPLSRAATIRRQHALIGKLCGQLEQSNQSLDTANAALNIYGNQVQAREAVIVALNEIIEQSLSKEISALRLAQDAQHGGPEHDDTHTPIEWIGLIESYTHRAQYSWKETGDGGFGHLNLPMYEGNLLQVAALAVAAIQSSRRKRAAQDSERDNPENGDPLEDHRV